MITSNEIRSQLKQAFDAGKSIFSPKVGKTAILKDKIYYTPSILDFRKKSAKTRNIMAGILSVNVENLESMHTGNSGIFDCDNFAALFSAIIKTVHFNESREMDLQSDEYAVFSCHIKPAHVINICFTDSGIWFIEPQTGDCWSIKEQKPEVKFIG